MWKGVLRNFTKFTGKHLRQSLFFNKVAGLRPKNTFLTEHLRTTASERNYYLFSILAIILCSTTDNIWSYCSLERFFTRPPRLVFPRSSFTDGICNEFCRELFFIFSKMSITEFFSTSENTKIVKLEWSNNKRLHMRISIFIYVKIPTKRW